MAYGRSRACDSPMRRWGFRLGAFVFAAVVLVAHLAAGTAYVFCSTMDEVVDRPCCPLHEDARHDGAPELTSRDDCCAVRRIPAAATGAPSPASRSIPPPAAVPIA